MLLYSVIYLVAVLGGYLVPAAQRPVFDSNAVTAVTVTALFASLLVSFAGFDRQIENWHRRVLQLAPILLLGFLMGAALNQQDVRSCVQLGLGTLIHAAYWMSAVQSRAYRLEQFKLGFSDKLATCQLVAVLSVKGLSHRADSIIIALLNGRKPELDGLGEQLPDHAKLLERVCGELNMPLRETLIAD